ncbi:Microfibrillar-associated protein 1 [Tolypocladium ophioglossoides CBS 100239]|uniref:Microfibrillar-associated protein 1 n=1 Tax=Tolypocladium ophioglossoides (strain CBS 100239) TaxID=1163406 RepID=A0A0L0NIV1_TOLOC|nr:Microfibrillar-associated protein 1 [Tolypocladium ophioglossoides CBS 100239]
MPPKRMTANPIRPSRHRAGKPAGNESSSESDSDAEASPEPAPIPPPPKASSAGKIVSNLNRVDLNARRQELEKAAAERRLAAQRAEKLATEQGFVTEEEEESEEEDEDESESEEEESSEEEAPRRLMIRPKFVPKSQRGNAKNPEQEEEAAQKAEEQARRKAADELVEEQIKKDLAARAAGKKHWDDDENEDSDVDTTDGLDPAAEEAAWRVRELKRLKRARTAIEERETELAEVERRRNLTAEERATEDDAHLARQREDRDAKGKMSYMQKYFHKGAFFQAEAEAAGLLQRDIMGARIQDDVRNREALPEYLQRRDMTKLGRKGATKYKDMRSEDTGHWGQFDGAAGGLRRGGRGGFDGDERFQPDDERFKPDERGAKGANAIPLGERREGGKDRRDEGDRHGNRRDRGSRDDDYQRRRSRSRSPRRAHDDHRSSRKRSTSRDADRYDSDKRRRVDVDATR